jgi:hypothetical protein
VERRGLCNELAGLITLWEMPWCIWLGGGGGVNVVRHPCERVGDSRHKQAMTEFSEFIFEQGLMDIPMVGGSFTWSNRCTWSKIDRFLLSAK